MNDSLHATDEKLSADRAIEVAIRIGVIALLVYWCFRILSPFIIPVLWGVIIAIGVYPSFRKFRALCGNRDKLAAVLITLFALALLITPSILLAESAINGIRSVAIGLSEATLTVPPPPDSVATWPVIGEPLHRLWTLASTNVKAALEQLEPSVRQHTATVLSAAAGIGFAVLQFAISILIAGVFLAKPAAGKHAAEVVCTRLAGERAVALVDLAEATIRSVVQGVLGVAFIQAALSGLGLLLAGVPLAGLWAILVLVLAVAQLPTILVLGRGVDVPMLVILLGAIGGMMLHGIIGLFVGAVVLAMTFKLYQAWLDAPQEPDRAIPGAES